MLPHFKHPAESISPQLTVTKRIFCRGFTLVELMVVIVIISILASLSLAGLNIGRQRSKIDATRATIRKLDEIVMDQFDSYSTRVKGLKPAHLLAIRGTMVEEMPDNWANVLPLANCSTSSGRAYSKYKKSTATSVYQGAECLYMIVTRSGFSPGALENFRANEVGDIDRDGMKEFLDGWGNPIAFLRWAPGFSSPLSALQFADVTTNHDALDVGLNDSNAFQMYPLIYSPGPDEAGNAGTTSSGYGILATGTAGWPPESLPSICEFSDGATKIGGPDPANPTAYRDNITNHDFLSR